MKSKSLYLLIVTIIATFMIMPSAFAKDAEVETLEEFKTACMDATISTIKLESDITITNADYNNSYYFDIDNMSRTVDLNGFNLNITKDLGGEYGFYIRFKQSNRTFTITNSRNSTGEFINNSTQVPFCFHAFEGCTNNTFVIHDINIKTKHSGILISGSALTNANLNIYNTNITNIGCAGSQRIFMSGFVNAEIWNFTYNKNGYRCFFELCGSSTAPLISDSLAGQSVYFEGPLGCIKQIYDSNATLNDIYLLERDRDFDMVSIKRLNTNSVVSVSSYNELVSALKTPEVTTIRLNTTIVIDSEEDLIVNINEKDKTLDLNGNDIDIVNNERFQIYYWTNNAFKVTDTSTSSKEKMGVIHADYAEDANSLFNVNNKKELNNMGLIFEKAIVSSISETLVYAVNGTNLQFLSGYFGVGSYLFYTGYDTSVSVQIGEIELYNAYMDDTMFAAFVPSYSSFGDDLVSNYLMANEKVYLVVEEDEYGNRVYQEGTAEQVLSDRCGGIQYWVVFKESNIPADIDLPIITNIMCNSLTGIVTWDQFEGANKYEYTFYTSGGNIDGSADSYDLKQYCINDGLKNGTYTFKIYAKDASGKKISRPVQCTYTFTSEYPQLDAPTNLRWDGMIARWDAVEFAEQYDMRVYKNNSYSWSYSFNTENNYYDFSQDIRFAKDTLYQFVVNAKAQGRPTSETSERSPAAYGWFEKTALTSVEISKDGIISCDPFEGAVDYNWTFYTGGGRTQGVPYYDLKDFAKRCNYPSGTYNVTFVAVNSQNVEISYKWEGTYTYVRATKGDINDDGNINIIDVKLLLQTVISGSNSYTDEQMETSDMNNDGNINIIDVKLLLQRVISG